MRHLDYINSTLKKLLSENQDLYIIGEDIIDPYGGAFKATKGLSTLFPKNVFNTPISEAGIIGFGSGMAMSGKKMIIEIMFGDFLSLGFDQILNNTSKFKWLYNDLKIPLIIRTPMGGYRGYGATHSQSIEKHFCGIPNFNVITLDRYSDIELIYRDALKSNSPTLIIENKSLYGKSQKTNKDLPKQRHSDILCVSYGGLVDLCVDASNEILVEEEINVTVFNINFLNPFNKDDIINLTNSSKKLLFVEESCGDWGFSDMCRSALVGINDIFVDTIKGPNHPIPSSKALENEVMPSKEKIKNSIKKLYDL